MQTEMQKTCNGFHFKPALIIFCASFFVFGFGVSVRAATGDITAIRIVGSSTTVADATSACNAGSACTGWVAEIDMSGLVTGGTYNLGMGTNNDPSAANVVCNATSLAYDTSGNTTTAVRTIYGTHQLRKIYNAGYTPPYPNDETNVSSTTTLRVALSDFVYSGDTSVTCNVAAGIYNDGTHSNNAGTNIAVTNNSTLAYPRAIANWSWPDHARITGSTLTLRAVGYQRHAKNKRPLAAMQFWATDAHSHATPTVTVNDMTIDGAIGDIVPVQEYTATLDTSGLTQGDLVTAHFAAIPWIGNAASIMRTDDGVNTQPTPLYAPQYYINDPANTYGTAAAVVSAATGNDTTCQATGLASFNGTNDAATLNPCATINKAAVIMRAYNGSHSSPTRTDVAGTMYLAAGTYTYTGASTAIGASSGTNPDKTWLTITPFPGVAKADVIINGITSTTYNKIGTTPLKISGITVNVTAGAPTEVFNANSAANYLWMHNANLTVTSGSIVYGYGSVFWTDNTVISNGTCNNGVSSSCVLGGFTNYSTTSPATLIRSNNLSGISTGINFFTVRGNYKNDPSTGFAGFNAAEAYTPAPSNQPIFSYNKIFNAKQSANSLIRMFDTVSSPVGGAIIENLVEYNSSASNPILRVTADGSANTPVTNVMLWHNTIAGQRINRCYNDSGSSLVLRTLWSEIGQLYDSTAIKSDTFTTANAGRLGNWACEYGVGYKGSIDAESGTVSNPVGVAGQFQAEFPGLYSKFIPIRATPDAQASSEPPSNSAGMHAVSWLGYVNRAAWDGTSVGAGNGDYHLTSSSPAASMIPATMAVLPYDLDGVARRNDGTGAAGAYEYTYYTVTPSAGSHGTISPNTAQSINYNTTTQFTITPDTDYIIDTVTGTCGGTLVNNTYTTNAITGNCTVIASFTPDNHTVTFNSNGGTGSMSNEVHNVATNLTANTFTQAGYTFTGWNTAANGSGTSYADSASYPFTADATLYAQWTALPDRTVTDPAELQIDATTGFITASASQATFNVNYTIQVPSLEVNIPKTAQMTQIGGGNINLSQFISQETSAADLTAVDVLKAIKFGLPNIKLTFSHPITISINVGNDYNNQLLTVYYQNEGETNWNQETTCLVVGGICQFQTTHATTYAATKSISIVAPASISSSNHHHHKSHHKKSKPRSTAQIFQSKLTSTQKWLKKTGQTFQRNLSLSSRGNDVGLLQTTLQKLGLMKVSQTVHNAYLSTTQQAVAKLQQLTHIVSTGVFGWVTRGLFR